MKSATLALATVFLTTASAAAQTAPPWTPVVPCDANAITSSRFVPSRIAAPRSGVTTETEQRQTSISLSAADGIPRYFVANRDVPLAQLAQATAQAWLSNTPGASIEQCWVNSDARAVGVYAIAGRSTTICRILILADDNVSYASLASARDALRDAGFTRVGLMTSDLTRVVFDDHLPLNPVPIRLQGVTPTIVRIMSIPGATEPIVSIGHEGIETLLSQLAENLMREVSRNNPALVADDMIAEARICIRPDNSTSYGDVLRVITTIREQGFRRAGLYSEAVVAGDDQGRPQ